MIRPTENFYSVEASLRYAREVLLNPEVRDQASVISLATQGQEIGHWAARGGIAPEQIIGVRQYSMHGYRPELGDLRRNDNYLFTPAAISHFPMPVHNATVASVYVAKPFNGLGFMSAAFANMGCDQQPQQCRKAFASHCLSVNPMTFKALRSRTVAKMIASGILVSSASGQLLSEPGHNEL